MKALVCNQCGAGIRVGDAECAYCGTAFEPERRNAGAPRQYDCPRCQVVLKPQTVGHARVAHCRSCSGLWVDHEAMHALLRLKKKHSRKVAALNQADKKSSKFQRHLRPGRARAEAAPARCPACHHSMRLEPATRDHKIYVDVCDDHGTWFDRSELAALWDRHARETLRRSAGGRESGGRRRDWGGDWDWSVGAGLVLLDAVTDLLDDGLDFFD